VDDASDASRGRIRNSKPLAQRLERAMRTVMAELGLERIERNRIPVFGGITEDETRTGIDETLNQPRRGHAIHAGVRSREPHAAGVLTAVGTRW